MPTEHNSPLYKNSLVPVDAASVAILRAAGALIFGIPSFPQVLGTVVDVCWIGKTTTTEFAATTLGPSTKNPHSTLRTPGGSSSGSGAAVADFQVPIALGTQTGGSTIRPGSFNGVYAYKPTWGAVSREGQKVYSLVLDTLGIFARGVGDLKVVAGVLGIKDDSLDGFEVKGARFGMVKGPVWDKAGRGTVQAMEKAKSLLEEQGAVVEEVTLPSAFNNIPTWHARLMAADARTAFLSEYATDKTKLHHSLIQHVENATGLTRKEEIEALDGIAALRPQIDEIANRYAALITPSVPDEAPLGTESTGSAAFNGMWTALHVPVVNVPGFRGENGMPVGLSLVGARFRDEHLLDVAGAVGEVFNRG